MLSIPTQRVIATILIFIMLKGVKGFVEDFLYIYKEYKEEIFMWLINNSLIDLGLLLSSILLIIQGGI